MTVPIAARPSLPQDVAELTIRGVILGALITVVFTASNVYLGLKVGLTFSSAIPSAIISMAVLRAFSGSNILENNMVQSQASAAGSLTSVIFIIPGLLMVGHWQGFPYFQTFSVCAAGGILGVLFTIPLRHAMVVESDLPYPEGVAAAEILRVGDRQRTKPPKPTAISAESVESAGLSGLAGTSRASIEDSVSGSALDPQHDERAADSGVIDIAAGSALAAAVSFATTGLRVLSDGASFWGTAGLAVLRLPFGFSLALLGAGYLIGLVAGVATLLGVVIAWGIAVPVLTALTPMPAGQSITAFATDIWANDVRFIGAGIIGVAAVWTLACLAKPVISGVKRSLGATHIGRDADGKIPRIERDMPLRWIAVVALVVVALLVAGFASFLAGFPQTAGQRWLLVGYGVGFAFIFGFVISAACGYMAGLVGSSSSPISGIGVVGTILISAILLLTSHQTGLLTSEGGAKLAIAFALFTTSAVLAVAAIANDNLQDLKTGWLVGATPWRQQVALLIGVLVGAAVMPPVLSLLYNAFGFTGAMPRPGMDASQALAAPQATLMASIANGIFTHHLNWTMLKIGAMTGMLLICVDIVLKKRGGMARLPVLAVGIGVYLPPEVSMPLGMGALMAWGIERMLRRRAAARGIPYATYAEIPNRRAVLIASGLIVGESLLGVFMAGVIGSTGNEAPFSVVDAGFRPIADILGMATFVLVGVWFWRRVMRAAA